MTEDTLFRAGEGELTYGRVLRQAAGMLRGGFGRVAVVALILFVPPPLLIALLEGLRDSLEVDPGIIRGLGFVLGLLMVTLIRLFGPVVYAGYLDEAVGREHFTGERVRLKGVMRSLPWIRLIVADVILVVGVTVGLAFFILPGIVLAILFGLVGPVIVQENLPVVGAFRRTYQLSRSAWKMIFILIVLLIAGEHVVEEIAHEAIHESSLVTQIAVEWIIAAGVGGAVGLIEVALATELMARSPRGLRHSG